MARKVTRRSVSWGPVSNDAALRRAVSPRRAPRPADRRGVIMLVVLSMLVLFMLVGTTFLITSGQYRTASRAIEKANRSTQQPADLLERALMQLLRDTNNRYSTARYHSLLRDLYGSDGFVGRIASPSQSDFLFGSINTNLRPRCAGVNLNTVSAVNATGTTQGQLVDLYVIDNTLATSPFADDNVVGLEIDDAGIPAAYTLSKTASYYNGCLLTLIEGPCAGQSVRVVDYDALTAPDGTTIVARLRVMAPSRNDGQSLAFGGPKAGGGAGIDWVLTDFLESATRGYAFMVNGRPLNGAGVGFNALAGPSRPVLTALEIDTVPNGDSVGVETALAPNYTQFRADRVGLLNPVAGIDPWAAGLSTANFLPLNTGTATPLYGGAMGPGDADESYDAADYQNLFLALQPPQPRPRGRVVRDFGTVNARGETDPEEVEAYYQSAGAAAPLRMDLDDLPIPSFHRPALVNFWFHRLMNSPWLANEIGDVNERARAIMRPYESSANANTAAAITAIKRKFILRPLREDHPSFDGSNPLSRYAQTALAGAINGNVVNTSIGNQITFPYWEAAGPWDVDNDADGVPDSVWIDMGLPVQKTEDGRFYKPLVALLVEDLDGRLNLNAHGSIDHFVQDDLDPSFGGFVNANLAQDYNNQRPLQTSNQLPPGSGWGPADITLRPVLSPELPLADALGVASYNAVNAPNGLIGNPQYDDYARLLMGRPNPRAANLPRAVASSVAGGMPWGRYGVAVTSGSGLELVWPGISANRDVFGASGLNSSTLDRLAAYDFYGWPQFAPPVASAVLSASSALSRVNLLRLGVGLPSAFGELPDLRGRYATGLSVASGRISEPLRDLSTESLLSKDTATPIGIIGPLATDSPYELNLSGDTRRLPPESIAQVNTSYATVAPVNDDAPFSPAELERLLRAYDADAAALPDRLWNVVDAFAPEKVVVQTAIATGDINADNFPAFSPGILQRVVAESQAALNRRLVTTESWDVPAPNENWTQRCLLGADGLPGQPNFDDDGDGLPDEGDELNVTGRTFPACDDYDVVMGALPPANARITDYLRYRVVLELRRKGVILPGTQPIEVDRLVNNVMFGPGVTPAPNGTNLGASPWRTITAGAGGPATFGGMLAPEVLAGKKMDLNRPFGDGRDNGDGLDTDTNGAVDDLQELEAGVDPLMNGIVDEPGEAGEPYIVGGGFLDLNGDGFFNATSDRLWEEDINLDGDVLDPGEFTQFNHVGGEDVNGSGTYIGTARIVDDARLARQLYARHLYCLMLLVSDENYLAPYDPNDLQVQKYLDPNTPGSVANQIFVALRDNPPAGYSGTPLQDARRIAMRKLTCRQIAQWAINTVDMRDPDAIQSEFEYDENPWDGWNVTDTLHQRVYPLDGDAATDENYTQFRPVTAAGFGPVQAEFTANRGRTNPNGTPITNDPASAYAYEQTRGVVWGAERPELLLTEGLAWHDRRLHDEDINDPDSGAPTSEEEKRQEGTDDRGKVSTVDPDPDDDLDQILKPVGPTFVEVYNPWDEGSQKPAELYRDPRYVPRRDRASNIVEGVLLDRLSNSAGLALTPEGNLNPSGTPQTSPVWRMICVETHPLVRNTTISKRDLTSVYPTGPREKEVELSDDPPLDAARNNDLYLGVTIENTPWIYSTDKVDPRAPQTPLISPSTLSFWNQRRRAVTVAPDSAFRQRAGVLEAEYVNPDPDFPSFSREAQPYRPRRDADYLAEVRISNPGLGLGESGSSASDVRIVERRRLIKPDEFIEKAFYFAGAPGTEYDNNLGALRDLATDPGVRIPHLFYELEYPSGVATRAVVDELLLDQGTAGAPDRKIDLDDMGLQAIEPTSTPSIDKLRVHASRFVVLDEFDGDLDGNTQETTPLAPILPGRYGVIGHPGAIYAKDSSTPGVKRDVTLENRYTTLLSRPKDLSDQIGFDANNLDRPAMRRIELIPSPDPADHQIVVRHNGGVTDETSAGRLYTGGRAYSRETEVINLDAPYSPSLGTGDVVANATAPALATAGLGTQVIQPAVAIPVEGFSISEPLDGYLVRQAELDPEFELTFDPNPSSRPSYRPNSDRPAEGSYRPGGVTGSKSPPFTPGYDEPFDVLPELIENQTTPNYRAMHLQRLANPLLAWNPPSLGPDGFPSKGHDPTRPVNPYLTTDTISLDLTSFNGVSDAETQDLDAEDLNVTPNPDDDGTVSGTQRSTIAEGPEARHQLKRAFPPVGDGRNDTRVTLQSQERGLHPLAAGDRNTPLPARNVWSQDRPTGAAEILLDRGMSLELFQNKEGVGRNLNNFKFGGDEAIGRYKEHAMDYPIRHSLGFGNRGFGKFYSYRNTIAGVNSDTIDIDGDAVSGDLVGVDQIDTSNNRGEDDVAPPAFHWPNRPFISEMELLQAPAWSSSRLLTYYSVATPTLPTQPNPYGNTFNAANSTAATEVEANAERWARQMNPYGHLLPFFHTAAEPAQAVQKAAVGSTATLPTPPQVVAFGAPHFYRLLDYVHVPSRFVGTDKLLNPATTAFGESFVNTALPTTPGVEPDARLGLLAPFNRVDNYREPGRVNFNTMVGRRDAGEANTTTPTGAAKASLHLEDLWSEVYDGVMHRRRDGSYLADANNDGVPETLGQLGHLGPAWRDLVLSRRGYVQSTYSAEGGQIAGARPSYASRLLNPLYPTFFANPLRGPDSGNQVPLAQLQQSGVDASWLRAHPLSSGADSAWGERGRDDTVNDKSGRTTNASDGIADLDGQLDDAGEAGSVMLPLDNTTLGAVPNAASGAPGNLPELLTQENSSPLAAGLSRLGDVVLARADTGLPDSLLSALATVRSENSNRGWYAKRLSPVPLFSGASREPSLDTERNASFRYSPLTRLANLATSRSGVFAVWITVGYFEVQPAYENPTLAARYGISATQATPLDPVLRDSFLRIYQDGYTLGQELDLDTGQNRRMKGFYLIDRTRPVAFKPGDDLNVENAVLLRRRVQ
ncbi:hypothetical protein [Botrimarina hoheduenensis]|uniref:Uncharacterized protein n=1 Tax=Botrimarina hoheduenensis TaxID=2528000 RepID=A0A5C5W7X9_9BACT|nr:hypothetical protein [Botrimarina hoheduenensis]TWT46820.1 hypothetical protein Pla111_19220 [Botrimarina hoheduenensis]